MTGALGQGPIEPDAPPADGRVGLGHVEHRALAGGPGPQDGGAEGVELALQPEQHLFGRVQRDHLGLAELDQAQLARHPAECPPAHQGVELEAEEGPQRPFR